MTDRAAIRDVASLARVSVGTVSNVFNRPDLVAEETRQRVEAAVATLKYVRNESARQLRHGQSRTVGLIVPDIANPFFTDVARGVEDVTSEVGVLVIVCNSDLDAKKEARYLTMLAEHDVLGVLHVPVGSSRAPTRSLKERGVPVVLLDDKGPARGQCSVSVNDVGGGELAVRHLLELGHRRIGFVGHSADPAHQVIDRLRGGRRAMIIAGHSSDSLQLVSTPSLNVRGGIAAARALLRLRPSHRPSAVACANDLLAIGLLQELLSNGLRVPDDLAIVGYDDIAFAEASAIPLTSIRQPRHQLGRKAAELLLDEASNAQHRHSRFVFQPELIVRRSSA